MTTGTRMNDRLVIVAVTILAGIVIGATGFTGFVEAARNNPAVSRFFLGYSLLFSGVAMWIQHLNAKAMINLANRFRQMGGKAACDKMPNRPTGTDPTR